MIGPKFDRRGKERLQKIISYIQLINDSITDISTESNPIDNTISVFVGIRDKEGEVRFPLVQCSDGTVKWIALLTKIIADESGFSIEEPENFLHPLVQKEFLKVVRSESSQSKTLHTLLTTHSESLLDGAKPDEIILVWMEDGKTITKRVSNSEAVLDEINRTGFGLGYYYTSGALEGA
jgi:predicted ATPase